MSSMRDVSDDEVVTQYGNSSKPLGGPAFRSSPRSGESISVMLGMQSPEEAAALIGRRPSPSDLVRRTVAGTLRQAGFEIRHDPVVLNPDHAVVLYEGEWTEAVARTFEECFEPAEEEGKSS